MARIAGMEAVYPNFVRVPEPIYKATYSAVVRNGSGINSVSWADLKSLSFARAMGIQILKIRTKEYIGEPVSSREAIIQMVARGRVDVGLMLTTDAEKFAKQVGGVEVLKPPIEETVLYHYVHFKNRNLIPALTKALQELNSSGRAEAILRGE